MFNLSGLGTLTGTTEFRVYVYNAPSAGDTFMDVRSSAADSASNGLILNGPAAPEPSSGLLVFTRFLRGNGAVEVATPVGASVIRLPDLSIR